MVLELRRKHGKRDEKFEYVISFFIDKHIKGGYSVILLWIQRDSRTVALDTGVKRSKIITQRGVDVGGFSAVQWAVSISGGLVVRIPSGILMKTLHSLPHQSFLLLCSFAVQVNGKTNIQYKTGYESKSYPNYLKYLCPLPLLETTNNTFYRGRFSIFRSPKFWNNLV
jgi:hypothetical protein